MTTDNTYQNLELWLRELKEAGWQRVKLTVFMSPDGTLYRGPFGAWKAMRAMHEEAA